MRARREQFHTKGSACELTFPASWVRSATACTARRCGAVTISTVLISNSFVTGGSPDPGKQLRGRRTQLAAASIDTGNPHRCRAAIVPVGRNRYPCGRMPTLGRRALPLGELNGGSIHHRPNGRAVDHWLPSAMILAGRVDNVRLDDDCQVVRTAMRSRSEACRVLIRRRHVDYMRISTAQCCESR